MADQVIPIKLENRTELGKRVKRLRRAGIIPVHLYGRGITSRTLQAPLTELTKVLVQAGRTAPVSITIGREKGKHLAFVRDIQWDPVQETILHVDFLQVDVTRTLRSEVPITLVGEAPAGRMPGASLVQDLYAVEVEALPMDMPHEIEMDVSSLTEPDHVIRVAGLSPPANVTILTDLEALVAHVEIAVVEEVVAEAEVEAEAGAEAEAAEGTEEKPTEEE
ncbi:MAG: 50S ribosomal protein L25 [Dehalococcoidia bacterium]